MPTGNRGRYPKTQEHREKLAEASRQQWALRKAMGLPAANLGVKFSAEARQHMAAARVGNKNAQRHGMSESPTWTSWRDMIQRCTVLSYPQYHRYGGRGIAICDRWLKSFESFWADMGERPYGTTLDRKNNDGNYEPGNCRWATPKEQAQNRSKPSRKGGGASVAAISSR